MSEPFSLSAYYGCLIRGNLSGAIQYLSRFPEQHDLHRKYVRRFVEEQYIQYDCDPELDRILLVYQRYYRNVFYLNMEKDAALDLLRREIACLLELDLCGSMDDLEPVIARRFQNHGLHFQGGRTGGYYGPYVWRETETAIFDVELPGGMEKYTILFHDGFLAQGWIDYLSFGALGTGGWTDGDGIINCVKPAYDPESEAFRVSLLKHEAQHVVDLRRNRSMSSEDLEYRAKLVELIYSRERNLLKEFRGEADNTDPMNGHAAASYQIVELFSKELGVSPCELDDLSNDLVRKTALALFQRSEKEQE